jgi:tetratricopeptide (TPR) repeat protein
MLLRFRLIRTLATCVAACVSCILAAAAQSPAPSPASMTLCASRDIRQVDQAIEACTAIIAASEKGSEAAATAYGYRGIALRRRAGSPQDFEQGLRDLETAIGAGPDTAIAHVFRGHLHLARRDPDLAIADCDEAIRRDPQLAAAFALRSAAFTAKQNFERAAGDYSEAIRIDPSYAGAIAGRAGANNAPADWSRADQSRVPPDRDPAPQPDAKSRAAAATLATRATTRYQKSDYAGAIADCDEALKLNPRNEQALRIRAAAHAAQGTASSNGGVASMPDALTIYVAQGPAGACGERCDTWLAVEGTADYDASRRVIAALDRLGTRKIPVVLNFRGRSNLYSTVSIGKILRERGFDATAGRTLVEGCEDPLAAACMALKKSGKPVQAMLVPNDVCDIACLLGLSGGVRRTLPETTTVVIGGMMVANRIGLQAVEPFRDGRHVQFRDLVKLHFTQMGVDPQVADMMEGHYASGAATELSRADIARLRIVTTR